MDKIRNYLEKNYFKRAVRTFLQTAAGYAVTNISLYIGGIDFADGNILMNTLVGLAVSAMAAGLAAVMNLREENDNG